MAECPCPCHRNIAPGLIACPQCPDVEPEVDHFDPIYWKHVREQVQFFMALVAEIKERNA